MFSHLSLSDFYWDFYWSVLYFYLILKKKSDTLEVQFDTSIWRIYWLRVCTSKILICFGTGFLSFLAWLWKWNSQRAALNLTFVFDRMIMIILKYCIILFFAHARLDSWSLEFTGKGVRIQTRSLHLIREVSGEFNIFMLWFVFDQTTLCIWFVKVLASWRF